MRLIARGTLLVALTLGLAACGLLSDDDKELEPAELIDFKPKLDVRRLWTAKLGGESEFLRIALQPVGDGNRIYAAGRSGSVFAFDPESGKPAWRTDLNLELAAGPGVGNGLVVVITADGVVVALESGSGKERWRAQVGGESLSRPAVSSGAVFVQTVDNRIRALASLDGRERWVIVQSMPALTVRGSASPIVVGSNVVTGFDNGRLLAINIDSGAVEWDTLLAPPSGRSDLERLSDIDGTLALVGQDIYAAGYQGRVAGVAAESGQMLWAVEVSSYEGVSADWTSLYTVQDDGVIVSLSRRNGAESWRQEALLRRDPSLAVPFNTTVAAGDFEGYLHFFNNVDGQPVARLRQGKASITADPVVVADRLYVQSDSGTLAAYEVRQPKPARRAPDIADEGA